MDQDVAVKKSGSVMRGFVGVAAALVVGVPVAGFILLKNLDVNSFKPKIEALASESLGRKLMIGGDIGIALSMTPTLTLSDVRLANAPWAGDAPMVVLGDARVKVDARPLLEKKIAIREVSFENIQLDLVKNKAGKGNWALDIPKKPAQDTSQAPSVLSDAAQKFKDSLQVNIEQVSFAKSQVRYQDMATGKKLTLDVPEVRVHLKQNVVVDANLAIKDMTAKVQATAASLDALAQGNADVTVALDGSDAQVKLDGTLKDFVKTQHFAFKVDAKASTLKDFSALTGSAMPAIKPVSISTLLSGTPSKLEFKSTQGTYGDMAFSGKASVDIAGKPKVKAQFSIPKIVLPKSDAKSSSASGGSSGQASGRVIPDAPLSLPDLGGAEADVALDVGLVDGDTPLKDVKANIALHGGVLRVSPLRVTVKNVPLALALSLRKQGAGAAVSFSAEGKSIVLGSLLKELGVSNDLDGGQSQMALQLSGVGDTIHHMLPSLNGSVMLMMDNAVYHGGKTMQQSASFLELITGKGQSSEVQIRCLATKMQIAGGVARPQWMVFETNDARIDGEGEIGLPQESLALKLYPRAKKEGLNQITFPVRVVGSFAQPSVVPDAQASLAMLAKVALELKGKGKNVAAISQSISSRFDIPVQNSPCLQAPEPADAAATVESLKDLAKEKRDEIKQRVQDVKQEVKSIKEDFKNIKDMKDPEAIQNTIQNIQNLQKLF